MLGFGGAIWRLTIRTGALLRACLAGMRLAYVTEDWRSSRRRMDFIRFTGEWFVYFVLIALGGGVLTAFTAGTFQAIGIDPEKFITQWLLPCGAAAATLVAAWLVEAKQSVVENIAPVLTRLFTPLFTAVLLAFLVAIGWTSAGINVEREALILFDLLLVVVLGLLLYSISARDPLGPARPVRHTAAASRAQRAGHRRAGATGDHRAHHRVRHDTQQGRRARRERHSAGQPRLVSVATAEVCPSTHPVCGARALADRLPAGLRRLGMDRGPGLSSAVPLSLTEKVRPTR